MTRAKISEYSATANDNTDVNGINIAEGCPPSSMNNMGREIMAALKRFQVGSDGDGVTVGGSLVVSGSTSVNTFNVDVISEKTSATGVTIDGVLLKDGGLNTSGQVVFNDAGADVDFRVEGDTDANLLFVDASADRVGIGTAAPAVQLEVVNPTSGDCAVNARASNNGNAAGFRAVANDAAGAAYNFFMSQAGATENFYIGGNGNNDTIVFGTGSSRTERARITSDGYLRMASGSGGIQFGGDTAAANALDDYEQGTWTPTVFGSSTAGTYTVSNSNAYYTKIGNQVTVYCDFELSAASGGSGDTRIAGLPFNYKSSSKSVSSIYLGSVDLPAGAVGVILSNASSGSSATLFPFTQKDNAAGDQIPISGVTTSSTFSFTFTYTVD